MNCCNAISAARSVSIDSLTGASLKLAVIEVKSKAEDYRLP
jgi:hypothetical protein